MKFRNPNWHFSRSMIVLIHDSSAGVSDGSKSISSAMNSMGSSESGNASLVKKESIRAWPQSLKCNSTVLPLLQNWRRSESCCMMKTPLPPHLHMLSGQVGSGILSGSKPQPWSLTRIAIQLETRRVLISTFLVSSQQLPCRIAFVTASVRLMSIFGYKSWLMGYFLASLSTKV